MSDIMRELSVHQEHEFLLKLEAAGLSSELASGVINSKDNWQAKKVVAFLNNGCKFIIQKAMEFLEYTCQVKIDPVKEFTVEDFYKTGRKDLPMFFGDNFINWIVNPMKKMKLFSEVKTLLHKFLLKKNAHDTEMQSDFLAGSPIIPVKKFTPMLKAMLEAQPKGEAKQDGLDNSGKANIFNVDLIELGVGQGVVAVDVRWFGDGWHCAADPLDYNFRWDGGYSFFSPATS